MSGKRHKVVHVEVKLDDDEVDNEDGTITSKYFRKKKITGNLQSKDSMLPVDVDVIKSLSSDEYFSRMDRITNDDPRQWDRPLTKETLSQLRNNEEVPSNFWPIFSRVRKMRSQMLTTPVDTMGCPRIPVLVSKQFGITRSQMRPIDYRLQLLVSLILASQTKDETVTKAMHNIMSYCFAELHDPRGISLLSLSKVPRSTLEQLIKSTGFYKRKAFYIEKTVQKLAQDFNGDIPGTISEMISLPGVGPKIGYLALQKSWGLIDGICVDVHVHRLCRLWKWVDPQDCQTAEQTRVSVERWLPRELWYDFNTILVGFGQIICGPKIRRCNICLANKVCNASSVK
ncbi:similar to Saccharomyces cerevisiae YAL015C NTG1 DNA N-glycosylase and apurinic/apyrimidinic (AP) lyase involved in base excision repair [Maudiozyma saulgeensis]|uniref:Endonuclease III homolog n=1 Tax=Maudiozyma saulgeensis TaxID=1789683 RepID=A0A1X7R2Y4_9SACH|nr:similar to Saccharomyces cerevisiae YAL015C NTG1 DNA N-glycosylase and apurinic/apyrimidinic (AP) lyase involved in base excision repair [Kazachstania saulgeensis]